MKDCNRLKWLEGEGNRERSKKQERRTAKKTGGQTVRASGATQGRKGDVNSPCFDMDNIGGLKIEGKTTKHESFTLKLATLRKIEEEAAMDGKKGAMLVTFEDKHDYLVIRRDFVY